MGDVHRIAQAEQVAGLVERLTEGRHARPVVVVTLIAGTEASLLRVADLTSRVGRLAEVHEITTSALAHAFAEQMPADTGVRAGAVRVYPVGTAWLRDPTQAPLHPAWSPEEATRALEAVVSDCLRLASEAGLIRRQTTGPYVEGVVKGVPVPSRAVVAVDRVLFRVAQELTLPGVPMDRVLVPGMTVRGRADRAEHLLDIAESLRDPAEALSAYGERDAVLARVRAVRRDAVELDLHPQVSVTVSRDDVTGNELDDLGGLLTPGETVVARVTAVGPDWALSLLDVDDDEEPLLAPALIDGGPPWLTPPVEEVAAPAAEPVEVDPSPPSAGLAVPVAEPESTLGEPVEAEPGPDHAADGVAAAAAPPSPLLFARFGGTARHPGTRPAPAPSPDVAPEPDVALSAPVPSPEAAADLARLTAELDEVRAEHRNELDALVQRVELEAAERMAEINRLREQVRVQALERDQLVRARSELQELVEARDRELKKQRSELRKARRAENRSEQPAEDPTFADPERGFRHEVERAWARRFGVTEQAERPLPAYDVGARFLTSFHELQGVEPRKVYDVVVEVLTDLAKDLAGRQLHQMRVGPGGSPYRLRDDGATCWRVSLQVNTAGARRLHYWQLPGGRIELARVGVHDELEA